MRKFNWGVQKRGWEKQQAGLINTLLAVNQRDYSFCCAFWLSRVGIERPAARYTRASTIAQQPAATTAASVAASRTASASAKPAYSAALAVALSKRVSGRQSTRAPRTQHSPRSSFVARNTMPTAA